MTTTWAQARRLVDESERPSWPYAGTFMVAERGAEDETAYRVEIGAAEWLVDGDPAFMVIGDEALLVLKATGEIQRVPVLPNLDRLAAMKPAP